MRRSTGAGGGAGGGVGPGGDPAATPSAGILSPRGSDNGGGFRGEDGGVRIRHIPDGEGRLCGGSGRRGCWSRTAHAWIASGRRWRSPGGNVPGSQGGEYTIGPQDSRRIPTKIEICFEYATISTSRKTILLILSDVCPVVLNLRSECLHF
nr:unnamed protein product [Callosobruchus analis]